MGRKKKKESLNISLFENLKEETKYGMFAIIFFVVGIFLGLAAFEKAGVAGDTIYKLLESVVGLGFFLLPILFFFLGITFFQSGRPELVARSIVGSVLFIVSGLGLIDMVSSGLGGVVGGLISSLSIKLFDLYITSIFLGALAIISLLLIFDTVPKAESLMFWKKSTDKDEDGYIENEDEDVEEDEEDDSDEDEDEDEEPEENGRNTLVGLIKPSKSDDESDFVSARPARIIREFTPPPISLLEKDKGKPGVGDVKANSNIIKRTLQNFGIHVEMDEISIGPSVTRYSFKPAEGVKLARIVALQNDLSLALAAHPIRIEAPIPGKSLVGIEIPNTTKTTVGLASLLSAPEYDSRHDPLLITLGKDISGKAHFGNLAKMPHMLIAGATGSGKSVMIHTVINSLLYRNSPENLKFIMIDPKRVELTLYKNLPYLLTPVVTDPKKAILSLKWAAKEMDRRYDILETESVRDISSYHNNILEPAMKKNKDKSGDYEENLPETMPYIVIIIDELADIMTSYPRELESAIVRLAQMSRAVGIHLILSTQRPSVNVITGLIKANIPARIALQVASQIDSRTILDTAGAEKLLGAGDMLFLSGEMSKPKRLQSAYVSEQEVKKVVKHINNQYKDSYDTGSELTLTTDSQSNSNPIFDSTLDEDTDDDDMYEEARETIVKSGKASTSYLQRKLRVGYARAARLIDMLEERGVVGPADGSKPRDVLIKDGGQTDSYDDSDTEIKDQTI